MRRIERGIAVKHGTHGTFALIARPWVRFPPFGGTASADVRIEADDFEPLTVTFPVNYDQRFVAAAAAAGDPVVTLNTTTGLSIGQRLLFGPQAGPQYVRIRTVAAGGQVTLAAGLLNAQATGDPVFPDTFATPPPVVVALRRRAITLVGRVVVRDTSANVSTPVANASVTVTDFWRTRAAIVANPSNGSMTDSCPGPAPVCGVDLSRCAGAACGRIGGRNDRVAVRRGRPPDGGSG